MEHINCSFLILTSAATKKSLKGPRLSFLTAATVAKWTRPASSLLFPWLKHITTSLKLQSSLHMLVQVCVLHFCPCKHHWGATSRPKVFGVTHGCLLCCLQTGPLWGLIVHNGTSSCYTVKALGFASDQGRVTVHVHNLSMIQGQKLYCNGMTSNIPVREVGLMFPIPEVSAEDCFPKLLLLILFCVKSAVPGWKRKWGKIDYSVMAAYNGV